MVQPLLAGKLGKLTLLTPGKSDPFRGCGKNFFLESQNSKLVLTISGVVHDLTLVHYNMSKHDKSVFNCINN